jgi:subtilase family serine protease
MGTRILLCAAVLAGALAVGAPAAHAGPQATPNLYVVSLGSGVSSDCTSINVNAFFGNNGDADSGQFGILFTIDTKSVVMTRVASVAPGAIAYTRQFSLTWPHPTPGDHTLTVILDATNRVVESNEDDNTLSQTFTCP